MTLNLCFSHVWQHLVTPGNVQHGATRCLSRNAACYWFKNSTRGQAGLESKMQHESSKYAAGLVPNTIGVVAVQWECWQDTVDVASHITGTAVQEAAGALEGRSAIPSGPVSSIP
ncbi:TPA: hypothetical protein ACH3X3_008076 [Trebouxia sp. C0006]